ncbi:glycosyl hydrolase family 9 domain-containing protein [Rhizoctonia solani AG-1 IA]|uniref:cellulase n=1 Tax=Thanatephorus cucumeris (strain AG1-IA) TaxID=983506 RepID=L8X6C6_THACA|nr:glycosyl hydrolase family 9 domain-containing protein [Rhizoctonia solani AG-1 IA]
MPRVLATSLLVLHAAAQLAYAQNPENQANSIVPYTVPSEPRYDYAEVLHKVPTLPSLPSRTPWLTGEIFNRACCFTMPSARASWVPTDVWRGVEIRVLIVLVPMVKIYRVVTLRPQTPWLGCSFSIQSNSVLICFGVAQKWGLPMAWTLTQLSYNVHVFSEAMQAVNEYDEALEGIKWGIDYLVNCISSPDQFVGQVSGSALLETPTSILDTLGRPKSTRCGLLGESNVLKASHTSTRRTLPPRFLVNHLQRSRLPR